MIGLWPIHFVNMDPLPIFFLSFPYMQFSMKTFSISNHRHVENNGFVPCLNEPTQKTTIQLYQSVKLNTLVLSTS
jgi:hypothetical protein